MIAFELFGAGLVLLSLAAMMTTDAHMGLH